MDDVSRAYERTTFWVQIRERRIGLKIGELNSDLDVLLMESDITDWAYVTAYNPGSVSLSDNENEQRQNNLVSDIEKKGYQMLSGEGCGETGDWPPEPSILILGIPVDEAQSLGCEYGQTAIVVGRRNEPPRLLFCHPESKSIPSSLQHGR